MHKLNQHQHWLIITMLIQTKMNSNDHVNFIHHPYLYNRKSNQLIDIITIEVFEMNVSSEFRFFSCAIQFLPFVLATTIKKTRVAYFLPGSDTPFVIQVAVPPESITFNHILPRLHISSANQRNTNTSLDYFVKHRASNENWLGGDTQFINEKIDDFDTPLPNIDGTVVIRILNTN